MNVNKPFISIIIPALNEEHYIQKVLDSISKNSSSDYIKEVLVIDGGSADQTVSVAKNKDARVISSKKGRAVQMNLGAKKATGDILYFLHVDTLPPKDFDLHILKAYADGFNAGCFQMKFDRKNLLLQLFGWLTRINHTVCRGGDQSLFITKSLFEKARGFDESYKIYEDNEFIRRIYKIAPFKIVPNKVVTSSRRYNEKGIVLLQWHFGMIHLKHHLGASPDDLYAYY
ncbi:unnamed protein product, partial [Ectocarpus sp. 12 AP-2014]